MGSKELNRPIRKLDEFSSREIECGFFSFELKCDCKTYIKDTFPIIQWMSEYNFKRDLPMDIIAGITVTVLQIPQGLAYAFLANVPSIYGLYTAFFPAFVYFVFGTSKHNNFGTFAVICLMVGESVHKNSVLNEYGEVICDSSEIIDRVGVYKNIEVLSAVTFTVSMCMLTMYIFQMGRIVSILSDTLLSAFTTACAFYVCTSQLKDLFGVKIPAQSPYFKIAYTIYEISKRFYEINLVVIFICVISITSIVINNEIFKPRINKICKFPIPMELIVFGIATLISYLVDLNGRYDVPLVGYIPTGLPAPVIPTFKLVPHVVIDCILITVVGYIITISMALIFAKKDSYIINPNQELLALGFMDLVGSFLHCVPVSASLSRSIVQYTVGGVSQFALVISALFILMVLLWAGPVMEYLPRCILASIIFGTIYPMFRQFRKLKEFWFLSKLDVLTWLVTFLSTVIVEIRIGLLCGIICSICVICYHSFKPNSFLMGWIADSEIYMSIEKYTDAKEIEEIKVFHYEGGINFATKSIFKSHLFRRTEYNIKQMAIDKRRQMKQMKPGEEHPTIQIPFKCVIIDFSAIMHIDLAGIKTLRNLEKDYKEFNVTLLLSNVSWEISQKLKKFDYVEKRGHSFTVFPTIHDAVLYTKQYVL